MEHSPLMMVVSTPEEEDRLNTMCNRSFAQDEERWVEERRDGEKQEHREQERCDKGANWKSAAPRARTN